MACALDGERRKSKSEPFNHANTVFVTVPAARLLSLHKNMLLGHRNWDVDVSACKSNVAGGADSRHTFPALPEAQQLRHASCRLEPVQLRVAQSASSMVPPLPLTLGTLKEKQAYERELKTVTVGELQAP